MARQVLLDVDATVGAETYVRRALGALEGELRRIALVALGEWAAADVVAPELFNAVAGLQRPAWGSWNGLLTALQLARRNCLQGRDAAVRGRLEASAGFSAVLEALNENVPAHVEQTLRPLAELVRLKVRGQLKSLGAATMPIPLRNQIAHQNPTATEWWEAAAAALRPLVEFLAAGGLWPGLERMVSGRRPWFITADDQTWAYNGYDGGSAVYVGENGHSRVDAQAGPEVLLAFQRLLGKTAIQEADFRRLLGRLAPEEVKGVLLGDFLVGRPIGSGGYGTVHVGRQLSTGRQLAIKILHDGLAGDVRERFKQEASYLSLFSHRNIVGVFGYGEETWSAPRAFSLDDEPWYRDHFRNSARIKSYIAMEWVSGRTLEDVFQTQQQGGDGAGGVVDLADWFRQAAQALAHVHATGLIHRDLKPANLMLTDDGTIKLMDFGIARSQAVEHTLMTTLGHTLGTPAYMAPEQINAADPDSSIGPASDIYSLSATFYELFSGQRLFDHTTAAPLEVDLAKQSGRKPPLPRSAGKRLPWEIRTILWGGLEREPRDRYASAEALAADLGRFLANEPIRYRRPGIVRRCRLAYRRNRLVMNLVAGFLTLAVSAGVLYSLHARRQEAQSLVHTIEDADIDHVMQSVRQLAPYRDLAEPLIRDQLQDNAADAKRTLNLSLALARERTDYLNGRLLDAEPTALPVICAALRPPPSALVAQWWTTALDKQREMSQRFRAAFALASFAPSDARWDTISAELADQMVKENLVDLGVWVKGFQAVRAGLIPRLSQIFRQSENPQQRSVAASVLATYAADQLDTLTELIVDADPEQYAELFPHLLAQREAAVARLQQVVNGGAPAAHRSVAPEALAKHQAQSAIALAQLGDPQFLWPLLRRGANWVAAREDPTRRTYAMLDIGRLKTPSELVLAQLDRETDTSARCALLIALGEFSPASLPLKQRAAIGPKLLQWYRTDPDSGVHSAIAWLLGPSMECPAPRKINWSLSSDLRAADGELAGQAAGKNRWYVSPRGQTFAILSPPATVQLGSPGDEPSREEGENLHSTPMGYRFAIATTDVTCGQFDEFLATHPAVEEERRKQPRTFNRPDESPVFYVTWYQAAQYCRWLSEQEHNAEDQMCYPAVETIADCARNRKPLNLPSDYLRRTGYRLPTEAEWEYACRAGADTPWSFGRAKELASAFAWYVQDSENQAWPVGEKRPNDFGLFDMHGNAWELCQDEYSVVPSGPERPTDAAGQVVVAYDAERVLHGGSFLYRIESARAALRSKYKPGSAGSTVGFRLARTVP